MPRALYLAEVAKPPPPPHLIRLGGLIRDRRRQCNVEQVDFGEAVGVDWDQPKVSRYERGLIPTDSLQVRDELVIVLGWTPDVVEAALKGSVQPDLMPAGRTDYSDEMERVHALQQIARDVLTPPPDPPAPPVPSAAPPAKRTQGRIARSSRSRAR